MHIIMQFWQEIVLNGNWDRSRMYSDDIRVRNWYACFTTLTNTETLSYFPLVIFFPIFNNYTRIIQLEHIPKELQQCFLLHIWTRLMTTTLLFILLVSTLRCFQSRMRIIVWGVQSKCSSSYSEVRFKSDSHLTVHFATENSDSWSGRNMHKET